MKDYKLPTLKQLRQQNGATAAQWLDILETDIRTALAGTSRTAIRTQRKRRALESKLRRLKNRRAEYERSLTRDADQCDLAGSHNPNHSGGDNHNEQPEPRTPIQ